MSSNWIYNNEPIEEVPEGSYGFIYLITNLLDNRKYIGKKNFVFNRTKKVKGKKNRKHYKIESDWKTYVGSCSELIEDVKNLGIESFKREILVICKSKGDLGYQEVLHQFKYDVLYAKLDNGLKEYYNRNIMNRFFYKE